MINKLMLWFARRWAGKPVIDALAWMHDKLDGRRSEITLGLLAVLEVLKLAGIVPAEAADKANAALLAILPVTLADKASKVRDLAAGLAKK